jgi:hypothetical protein
LEIQISIREEGGGCFRFKPFEFLTLLIHFSDTGDEGDCDDGKPRSEKDKKEGEEKKSKSEINLGM